MADHERNMEPVEDRTSSVGRNNNQGNYRMPEHLEEMARVHTNIDVIETTTKTPYREINFIGTYMAIAFATCGAFAGFVMPVTALSLINAEIGPSPNNTWVALAWTLCSSVGFTLVGRLSDIFGRRWFFTGASLIGTVGGIVGCTANDINQLIGASVLLGFAAAGQISFNYVLGELVPVRHRFAANGFIFLMTFPFSGIGPYLARLFIVNTSTGWRGIYYLTLALNGTATVLWFIFYHPPKFENLHRNRTKMQELRELDYGGIVLFTGGLLLFLLGLSWGGEVHPWRSGYVLGTLITGIVVLIMFVFYEIFMPLRRPLVPMHLFRNFDYDMVNVLSIVGGMVYYSMNDVVKAGLISCAVGGGVCCGQFLGSWIAVPGGHLKWKLVFVTVCLTAFTAGLAGCTDSQAAGSALATLSGISIGVLEVCVSTMVTIVLDDQSEMGTGAGVFGSLRGAGGVLAVAIYVSILMNKVTHNIEHIVAPALIAAGLPVTSVKPFLSAVEIMNTAAVKAVPGITPSIIAVGTGALRTAYAKAFQVVWLATIAFGALSVICALISRPIEQKFSHDVIRRLNGKMKTRKMNDMEKQNMEHVESA